MDGQNGGAWGDGAAGEGVDGARGPGAVTGDSGATAVLAAVVDGDDGGLAGSVTAAKEVEGIGRKGVPVAWYLPASPDVGIIAGAGAGQSVEIVLVTARVTLSGVDIERRAAEAVG